MTTTSEENYIFLMAFYAIRLKEYLAHSTVDALLEKAFKKRRKVFEEEAEKENLDDEGRISAMVVAQNQSASIQEVYTLVEHNKTYLLGSPDDICAAPHITESLMQLANLMRSTLKDIAAQSQLTQDILPAHQDWKRPSAGIPVRTEKKDQSPSLSS